jgi:hypothetical protein
MTSNPRCEILKKRLTELYEDYAAVVNQLGRTLVAVDEMHLKRQMAELEARIEDWEARICLCVLGATQTAAQAVRLTALS